jgi:hypothetical protein
MARSCDGATRAVALALAPTWTALCVAACGGSPRSAEPRSELTAPTMRAAPPVDPAVGVVLARVPERVVVDGDLGEWSASAAAPVHLALGPGGIAVAARLDPRTRGGFWVGVDGDASELPPVGNYVEIYGSVPDGVWQVVPPGCVPVHPLLPPSDAPETPECIATQRAREDAEHVHASRFRRWYRIEPSGVSVLDESRRVSPVSGARVAFRDATDGGTAEASIPLAALPRFVEAPITELRVAARVATAGPAELTEQLDRARTKKLPEPVAFEPLAELRAEATKRSPWMSYHPAQLDQVEVARYPSFDDRRSFEMRLEPLYRKIATVGAAEIGHLTVATPLDTGGLGVSDRVALAVTTRGKIAISAIDGVPVFTAHRGAALHLFSFARWQQMIHDGSPSSVFVPATIARWHVFIVEPDGTSSASVLHEGAPSGWRDVEPVHDAESIGMKGDFAVWISDEDPLPPSYRAGNPVEVRWRWDPTKRQYLLGPVTIPRR